MAIYQAKWICPALCGCEIRIHADWAHDSVEENGETVQHAFPKEGTITDIQLVNACSFHDHYLTDPLPADPYQGCPGYFKLTGTESPVEKLFIMLYKFSGGVHKPDTCDCQAYVCSNRFSLTQEYKDHPVHSKKCKFHLDDTDHQKAIDECRLHNETKALIKQSHPELSTEFVMLGDHKVILNDTSKLTLDSLGVDYSEPSWELKDCDLSFDKSRNLVIEVKSQNVNLTDVELTLAALDVTVK